MEVIAHTSSISKNSLWRNNYERMEVRFVNHAHDMPTHPDLLHFEMGDIFYEQDYLPGNWTDYCQSFSPERVSLKGYVLDL